uniref:F-box domain-containing protein n=1 Tax=Ceratitis capitata TaxID=7213 RepID=W8BJI8_CERCA
MAYIKNKKHSNLLRLDDDAVLSVWHKLQPIDRVQLASSCRRFRKIFEERDAAQYAIFKMETLWQVSVKDIDSYARLVAPLIQELRAYTPCVGNVRAKKFLKSMTGNCEPLRRVIFKGVRVAFQLFELLANAKYLTELCLQNCRLLDKDVDMITMLSNLMVLDLSKNNDITACAHSICRIARVWIPSIWCMSSNPPNICAYSTYNSHIRIPIWCPYFSNSVVIVAIWINCA